MGCKTLTPAWDEMRPVMTGKKEPPSCAKTNTNARAVDWVRGEKSLDPIEMPCGEGELRSGRLG